MNKGEFIKAFAENSGTSVRQAEEYFKAFEDTVTEALRKGETITLTGFGVFSVKDKKAHSGFNPKTHEKIQIKACHAPAFRFSKSFKESL